MPCGLNKVAMIVWVSHDPEMRYTPTQWPVTCFSARYGAMLTAPPTK